MRVRYQGGYLRLGQRKKGPDRWEFLWWDFEANGTRVRRKAIIGTVKQYPNLENAWQASNGLRVSINETRNRQREQTITVADLVDHYMATELASAAFLLFIPSSKQSSQGSPVTRPSSLVRVESHCGHRHRRNSLLFGLISERYIR